jgi:hypothetical protein
MDDKLSSGQLLSQTFSVFFSNFPAFGLISGLVLSPMIALSAWQSRVPKDRPAEVLAVALGVLLLSLLLTPIVTGALTYGVFQQVRGKKASASECLRTGFKHLFPVLGVSLLMALAVGIGCMLCLVPGVILMTMFSAAVPTAVIERPGVTASLSRSRDLTQKHRWCIFGVIFVIWLIQICAGMALLVIARLSAGLQMILHLATSVISQGLQATAPALIYYHLRRIKESIDVEEIAAVFD